MASDMLCVVTGTSAGIGRAVAEALLARDWRVLGIARREVRLHDHNYTHVRLDLADVDAVERYFVDEFSREFPAHDYRRVGLVNNAGLIGPLGPLPKLDLHALRDTFTVNTVVPIWLMGYFQRHCGNTPLRIVNVSTGAAVVARAGQVAYCASKAALLTGSRVFGDEAAHAPATEHKDAALLSYEPGMVDTEMQTQIRGTSSEDLPGVQRFLDAYGQGRLADAARPAREIADFLAKDHLPAFSEAKIGG
ncbi:MAG TPA: SDR family NAD(P)-dependent oxidoreductase [bacterium]